MEVFTHNIPQFIFSESTLRKKVAKCILIVIADQNKSNNKSHSAKGAFKECLQNR